MSDVEPGAIPARRGMTLRVKVGIALVLAALFIPLITNEYRDRQLLLKMTYLFSF